MSRWRRWGQMLRILVSERRGNVLMIVALSAPLVFGSAGFAVDYGYASYLKRSLDQAADSASLAATSQSAAASGGGYGNLVWLRQFGLNTFAGNTSKLNVGITPTLTVVPNGTGGVVATTSYTYNVPTYFSSLLGIPTIPIAGSATATANPITYIDYYILLDISQSMGIGATQADMQSLFNRSQTYNNDGCVFGCHVALSGEPYNNLYLAHNMSPAITLRIDSAITAIQNIITDAQNAAGPAKNIRIGIYTMSDDPVSGKQLNVISSPSSDYTGLAAKAAAITLGNNTSGGLGDTNYASQISQFNAILPINGAGFLATFPKQYAFIITDGISDVNKPGQCYYGHCNSAFDPSNCIPLQLKATVGTIYTTYLPIYNNNDSSKGYRSEYTNLVQPYASQLAPNMQSCATNTSLYYEASDGPGINAAMKALFASTLKTARLTQ